MRLSRGLALLWPWLLAAAAHAQAPRTWYLLPTGNGHGFQVFDRQQSKITVFLEHPYRYVAPGDDGRTFGIGRRDLAHDLYFGVRAGGTSKWIYRCGGADCIDYTAVEYEDQSHVIRGTTSFQGATIDTYAFAPFGYAGNALLMLLRVTNGGGGPLAISVYAKPNLKLGQGRVDPDDVGEALQWNAAAAPPHAVETGPGGGHALYVPIPDATRVGCGSDAALYNAVLQSGNAGTTASCSGNALVPVFQKDLTVAAGGEAWWGLAVLFLNDNPADGRAAQFRDPRTVSDVLAQWTAFAQGKDAKRLHDDALAELAAWRTATAPSGLTERERKLWRQSEVVLRMGQIREKPQNDGMILASLPPGEWHTGWVRDAAYAIAALAMTGHVDEAQRAVRFFLGADAGFFRDPAWVGRSYRVGVCRYFGNGLEEGDFNQDGPNIETDGWGLMLWAARLATHYGCNKSWLDSQTRKGDSVFAALVQVAADMEAYRQNDLPLPDASIWEVHWNRRQVFAYTTAAWVRGFHDFADLAAYYGRSDLAGKYRAMANAMLGVARTALVHQATQSFASHLGVAGNDVHVDGSTVGFLDWRLIAPSDPIHAGTLASFSRLTTGFGGYRRLEPQLSLTGGGSAGEYDLAEWILLDLRIADGWRRAGDAGRANALLDKVTDAAAANDNLVPELYDPNNGRYTGVVPMVGYGAGAWMMSQLVKHGLDAPAPGAGFAHCSACASNPCTNANEVCVELGAGGFRCDCAAGYHREGAACLRDTTCNPATTCAGHGTCTGAGLECACDAGYAGASCTDCAAGHHRDGAACVADTACNPNPCTGPNRTICEEADGGHACRCVAGYRDEGGSCVAEGPADGGAAGLRDGSAMICAVGGAGDALLVALALLGLAALRRRR